MNFSKLTYKEKSIYLMLGLLVLLILSILFSFRKTFLVISLNEKLKQELTHARVASQEIDKLKTKTEDLNDIMISNLKPEDFQLQIFASVSTVCDSLNVKMVSLKRNDPVTEKDISVENLEVVLTSDYKRLVKVINYLERNMKGGYLSSVKFELQKNKISRREEIISHLFIQGILKVQ